MGGLGGFAVITVVVTDAESVSTPELATFAQLTFILSVHNFGFWVKNSHWASVETTVTTLLLLPLSTTLAKPISKLLGMS